MAKTLGDLMSNKMDSIDKAKEEIDKLKIEGVSTRITKRRRISKSDQDKIRKAREQLKEFRSGGR